MKLIKKNGKDYYDGAVGLGIDPSIVYIRESKATPIEHVGSWNTKQEFEIPSSDEFDYNCSRAHFRIIGFCGVLYPVARVTTGLNTSNPKISFLYTYAEYKEVNPKKEYDHLSRMNAKKFFETYTNKRLDNKFVELDTPVFIVDSYNYSGDDDETYSNRKLSFITNPILKDWQFYKIKDSFSCFQDISQYIGNQLVKTKEIKDIADVHKIAGHGFDLKTSFRHPNRVAKLKNNT